MSAADGEKKRARTEGGGGEASSSESTQSGFGNEFATEALPGALPVGRNNPQRCPYGLYAEQLSGTAFTAPRHKNQRSWLYRVRPSVLHAKFVPIDNGRICSDWSAARVDPNQFRWAPEPLLPEPDTTQPPVDFVAGLATMAGAGDPTAKEGLAIHYYNINASMVDKAFSNSDGDLLVVPETGTLKVVTEFGTLEVAPCEVCVLPRGVRFTMEVDTASASGGRCRGYACELYQGHFELPGLGPIGSNGLANARDFLYPVAKFEDRECNFTVVNKFGGQLFSATMDHSPYDVVAWHGNYAPYKYDLRRFCCMNSVTFDHPDPSIYTVLTAPTNEAGVAICDFVIFPPRWMVMEQTFRPPWYHRNCMTEFMGMVWGKYDAKEGFCPGGASLHSCMTPHGPDAVTFEKATAATQQKPEKFDAGLAFMFESTLMLKLTPYALGAPHLDKDYAACWTACKKNFTGDI